VPNPSQSALVRAAGMRDSTWLYHHEVATAAIPQLPRDSHFYLTSFGPISAAVQQQMAVFFVTGGQTVFDPNTNLRQFFGQDIFQIPQVLPEQP
jgi:hypothetical protein